MARRQPASKKAPAAAVFHESPAPASPTPIQAPPNAPASQAPTQAAPPGKRQPVLLSGAPRSRGALCAEVAGGTAADCAAVCCCCPCGILSLLLLAVVKLPAEMCRRAFLKGKRKMNAVAKERRKGSGVAGSAAGAGAITRLSLLGPRIGNAEEDEKDDIRIIVGGGQMALGPGAKGPLLGWPAEKSPSMEVSEMDREMCSHFYGAGFWRSPSQRDD